MKISRRNFLEKSFYMGLLSATGIPSILSAEWPTAAFDEVEYEPALERLNW